MRRNVAPNVPYIEASAQGGRQRPTAIFLYNSGTPAEDGAAAAIANYWHRPGSVPNPNHYVVDEANVVRTVFDNVVAGEDEFRNKRAISINICSDGYTLRDIVEDAQLWAAFMRAADLVARLCLTYKIDPSIMSSEKHRKWSKWRFRCFGGISVQTQGTWPTGLFQGQVRTRMRQLSYPEEENRG